MLLCIIRTLILLLFSIGVVGAQETFESMNKNAQLLSAAKRNQIDLLERALKNGAAPNSRNRNGDTPLNLAARNGNLEMVRLLLEASGAA